MAPHSVFGCSYSSHDYHVIIQFWFVLVVCTVDKRLISSEERYEHRYIFALVAYVFVLNKDAFMLEKCHFKWKMDCA